MGMGLTLFSMGMGLTQFSMGMGLTLFSMGMGLMLFSMGMGLTLLSVYDRRSLTVLLGLGCRRPGRRRWGRECAGSGSGCSHPQTLVSRCHPHRPGEGRRGVCVGRGGEGSVRVWGGESVYVQLQFELASATSGYIKLAYGSSAKGLQ